ncbi:hypothetical protein A7U60_g7752 [Sanghuangporus baumii]|uniref:Uncharacterized protein n=1 Tax=Sanghuangporus baumii TaxID=108892 RepID=A0A9Q5MZJ0_SANBA|nr:hypothetical protein A7U60_g7752 [Sanghuangporus baumii]
MSTRRTGNITVSSSRSAPKQPQIMSNRQYPAELVTYRLGEEMVYVEPPQDHEVKALIFPPLELFADQCVSDGFQQALDFAKRVFPSLADIPRARLAFQVSVRVGSNESLSKVRIAPMAWARAMKSLATYEIIEIVILAEPTTPRVAQSETDFAVPTASGYRTGCNDAPPNYSSSARLCDAFIGDAEKSSRAVSSRSEDGRLLSQPAAPPAKRSPSPFSWLTRRL